MLLNMSTEIPFANDNFISLSKAAVELGAVLPWIIEGQLQI